MNLSTREDQALRDIAKWNERRETYSKHWTPKTNVRLESKGLVRIGKRTVGLTEEGRLLLESL